jgi:hypothetical protein
MRFGLVLCAIPVSLLFLGLAACGSHTTKAPVVVEIQPNPPVADIPPLESADSCPEDCGGPTSMTSPELNEALTQAAHRGAVCYKKMLDKRRISTGAMLVQLNVAGAGKVCDVQFVEDSVHDPALASCIQALFTDGTFPPPQHGCVTVNVPFRFAIRNHQDKQPPGNGQDAPSR